MSFKLRWRFGKRQASVALALDSAALSFSGAPIAFSGSAIVQVSTASQLENAIAAANAGGGNVTIRLADGTYQVSAFMNVTAPNIAVESASGNRDAVIIRGDAMSSSANVEMLFRVTGNGFRVENLTMRLVRWHLIQLPGAEGGDGLVVRNCVLEDAYEQLLKTTLTDGVSTADNGLVEDCLFRYTAGIGPQYYIGGIDAHGSKNWIVRNNTFRDIASPSGGVAEFAVHFWNQSADNVVEGNTIIDCDRGIGFGLATKPNTGGVIRNNFIHHTNNSDPFADVGIALAESPGTQVYNNTVFQQHAFPWCIEYRYPETTGVLIVNNLCSSQIFLRDGATGTVSNNVINATAAMFTLTVPGDLHLASAVAGVVNSGQTVSGFTTDFDGQIRTGLPDIGADEYVAPGSVLSLAASNLSLAGQTITLSTSGGSVLLQSTDLTYLGAFRMPLPVSGDNTFNWTLYTALSFYPEGNGGAGSLFAANSGEVYGNRVAEISIPTPVNSSSLNSLNRASVVQTFRDATEGTLNQIATGGAAGFFLGGTLPYNGRLIMSGIAFYDNDNQPGGSMWSRPLTLATTGDCDGPVAFANTGGAVGNRFRSGGICPIPSEWRTAFGGPVLVSSLNTSIAGTLSNGPAATVIDPDDIGVESEPIPARMLLGYPDGNDLAEGTNDVWNWCSLNGGVAFINGTDTILFAGEHGTGPFGYYDASSAQDPVYPGQGSHAYPYRTQIWAYDANDLVDVKNGAITNAWDVQPYAVWSLTFPTAGTTVACGVAFDPATRRLYIAQRKADNADGADRAPIIHVYEVA